MFVALLLSAQAFMLPDCDLRCPSVPTSDALELRDAFGRSISERGFTLLDWQGPIANPAIKLTLGLPEDLPLPSEIYIAGSSPRIHFDRADDQDRSGIGKRIRVTRPTREVEFYVSIFPDRDGAWERHELMIQVFGPERTELHRLVAPVLVIDHDTPGDTGGLRIHLDFSHDRTGFFSDPAVRRVIQQAADDWSCFLADHELDIVGVEEESIQLWDPTGFVTTRVVRNSSPYRGFMMYVAGINHDEMRAGGAPSRIGQMHTSDGEQMPLLRSGSVEFDTRGNWNVLGWFLTRGDDDWWVSGNLRSEPNDLYSIALHEMGHALAFHPHYPNIGRAVREGALAHEALRNYLGRDLRFDSSMHMEGIIDPVSLYGAFGMEFQGRMRTRRWLITKTHLLALEAAGYRLRPTSAFETLQALPPPTARMTVGERANMRIRTQGGVPTLHFSIESGDLPEGLTLDSFSGVISGTPQTGSSGAIRIRVEDQDPTSKPVTVTLRMQIDDANPNN